MQGITLEGIKERTVRTGRHNQAQKGKEKVEREGKEKGRNQKGERGWFGVMCLATAARSVRWSQQDPGGPARGGQKGAHNFGFGSMSNRSL